MSLLTTIVTSSMLTTYLTSEGLSASNLSHDDALSTAKKIGQATKSQATFAAWIINLTEGAVTVDELTQLLREEFPAAKIGDRHGSHFASLSRNGKLDGANFAMGKKSRASTTTQATTATPAMSESDAVALIARIKNATSMDEIKALLNTTATEPAATEPAATEPAATEPAATELSDVIEPTEDVPAEPETVVEPAAEPVKPASRRGRKNN